ncbi:MAG: hypothetical protein RR980_03045 [Mucinivorans sp.]
MLTFIVAIIAVAFLMLALSITQIRKGHDLQGDVGNNDEMKARGLDCALKGEDLHGCQNDEGKDDGCASCNIKDQCTKGDS